MQLPSVVWSSYLFQRYGNIEVFDLTLAEENFHGSRSFYFDMPRIAPIMKIIYQGEKAKAVEKFHEICFHTSIFYKHIMCPWCP